MAKFKRGDRVKIVSRTVSLHYGMKDVGTVGYITLVDELSGEYEVSNNLGWYAEEDLELITEGQSKVKERRTFKLLKDTPTLKKGALYQEACDDGTQEYILISPEFYKGSDNPSGCITDRSMVEKNPDWFVEVFKVTPEYMTREEIDKYHSFIGKKTVKKAPKQEESSAVYVNPKIAKVAKYLKKHTAAETAEKFKLTVGTVYAYSSMFKHSK